MNKLFKLREWLTLEEAAAHISNVLGETANIADLYRFSLDGHLTLSVDFVNHAQARKGRWLKTKQIEFELIEYNVFDGTKLSIPYELPKNNEIRVSEDDWIYLENSVVPIKGIWDLTMVGAERLDIEHYYQQLTSGLAVTIDTLRGIFVQKGDVVCELQQKFDDNEYQKGSKAQQNKMEQRIISNKLSDDEAIKLRANFKVEREKYLAEIKGKPKENNYFPASELDYQDFVLVIRTQELTRFIRSLEDTPAAEKALTPKERNSLLVLIGALCKEVKIDPSKRGVAASLVSMTQILGAPLTDDTIRKILSQIEEAVSLRNK